ncbi:MAG: GxxExxY protein [Soonwooa sp.]
MITQAYLRDLTYKKNGACIEVHKILGAGLLENVYYKCLEEESKLRDLKFAPQFKVPVNYKGKIIDCHFFCDFFC